jgi:hypothetical protein
MAEIELPRPFAFDEFYAMLKKYVNDPKAREALADYDAEAIEGRGQLDDSSTSSELAYDADSIFHQIGWSILVSHGWPIYYEMIQSTGQNHELQMEFLSTAAKFRSIAKLLIRGSKEDDLPRWLREGDTLPDKDFDIHNPASVLRLLRMWSEKHPRYLPYTLTAPESAQSPD